MAGFWAINRDRITPSSSSPIRQNLDDISLYSYSFPYVLFELFEEHLDLMPLKGERRAKELKFFPELS